MTVEVKGDTMFTGAVTGQSYYVPRDGAGKHGVPFDLNGHRKALL